MQSSEVVILGAQAARLLDLNRSSFVGKQARRLRSQDQ